MKDLGILKCTLCVFCFKRATIHACCVLLSFFYTHFLINVFIHFIHSFNNCIIQCIHIINYNNNYSNL